MNKLFKKLVAENNLLIMIPAVVVVLVIIAFMVYGFNRPNLHSVDNYDTLVQTQILLEAKMIEEYNEGTYTPSDPYIKINPYRIAPLTALMMFETETVQNYKLVIKGQTEEADWEFITPYTTSHKIPVYGMYHGLNTIELYEYDDVNEVAGELVHTEEIRIVSKLADDKIIEPTTIVTTYEYFGDDLMFLTPATSNLPTAYDYNGDIRWYLNTPLTFAPNLLENGHLLLGSDRIMSDPYYNTGLFEIDLLGKIYTEFYVPGGYHHDFVELANGNLLVLSNDFQGTVEDIIVELDRTTGEVIKTWDLADYLPMTKGTAEMWTAVDWFHNNSIDYDPLTDSIVLSGRHQDAVVSIGYTSNQLNWIIGEPDVSNWDDQDLIDNYFFTPVGEIFEWQYAQHSANVLPNGDIFIFDNGNNKSKNYETYVDAASSYSRGVIYNVNTDTMEISQVYEYGKELGSGFYSPYISNVEFYADNHYMIHSGGIASSSIEGPLNIPAPLYDGEGIITMSSITIEILNDVVEYKLEVSDNFYRAARIKPYNDLTSFNLGAPRVLGSQQVTPLYTEDIPNKITLFKNVPAIYELSLAKETDRLVVEGVFNRYDSIYLVLINDTGRLTYNIPTSRTAYTAMCTAVFQDDSRFLTFYINEQNVEGTFSVFININGHEYDTYEEVEFN